ncbi:MAG: hypothetical protein VX642_09365 [Bdellovibrionota bacterium]|nr:hypothetical protein [Bdellovibrionota bacterium]
MKYLLVFLLISIKSFSLSEEDLNDVFVNFHQAYSKKLLVDYEAELQFNPAPKGFDSSYWWEIDHASARFVMIDNVTPKQLNIFVFGGLARVAEMNKDSMAISICHELGHLLAGPPYKLNGSSVEGAADYFSSGSCLRQYFMQNPPQGLRAPSLRETETCESHYSDDISKKLCLRSFAAIDGQLNFLRLENVGLGFWDESKHIAKSIQQNDYYYPEPSCRLQTMRNAILNEPAPICWLPR